MSIDKKHITSLRKHVHAYALLRREVIKEAGDALHHAKRAIFAMQRHNIKEGEAKLAASLSIFLKLNKRHKKNPGLRNEGAYKAALEEYVEASLLHQFVTKGKIGKVPKLVIDPDVYLAGLADVPGELYRYAVKAATAGDRAMVEKCEQMSGDIISELIEFDVTKYLRTKFDQAKMAHQKLEIVLYELSIRE